MNRPIWTVNQQWDFLVERIGRMEEVCANYAERDLESLDAIERSMAQWSCMMLKRYREEKERLEQEYEKLGNESRETDS